MSPSQLRALLLLLFFNLTLACDSVDKVCVGNVGDIGDLSSPLLCAEAWIGKTTCPSQQIWTNWDITVGGPNTPTVTSSGDPIQVDGCVCTWASTSQEAGCNVEYSLPDWQTAAYDPAAVCNIFGCNCDLCAGCGNGRLFGGTPSCNQCAGGCGAECGNSNWNTANGGSCTTCGGETPDRTPVSDTGCGDMEATLSLSLEELIRKLSAAFCKHNTDSVGFKFLGDILSSIDVDGSGDIICEEYQILKLTPRSGRRRHKGITKLSEPLCALSHKGRRLLKDYNDHLQKYFKPHSCSGTNKKKQNKKHPYEKH